MRNLSGAALIGASMLFSSSASAALVHAVLDEFSSPTGLGFTRSGAGGAGGTGGVGSMPSGGSFTWSNEAGFDASAYSGIAFRVNGDLTGADLQITLLGQDMGFFISNQSIISRVAGGWAYVSWLNIEEDWGPGSVPVADTPIAAVAIMVSGNAAPISIDDVMFAVPAPGAAALVGLAGLITARRRKA